MEAYTDSELVIGLVGAVGTDLGFVVRSLAESLSLCSYTASELRISKSVIPKLTREVIPESPEFKRISILMDLGNQAREKTNNNAVLAYGCAAEIQSDRRKAAERRLGDEVSGQTTSQPKTITEPEAMPRCAYIINSLKRPEEVKYLREIYGNGFYLIGVYSDEEKRQRNLVRNGLMSDDEVHTLIKRDEDEEDDFGQLTRETFHLADYFIHDSDEDVCRNSLQRFIDLLFGHPYRPPTFDEFAMFSAFTSALRSADLSRQVGAVVANKEQIVATGANECPKFGGGLYWSRLDPNCGLVSDEPEGRDFKRGFDSNAMEKKKIVNSIYSDIENMLRDGMKPDQVKSLISKGRVKDITEYGRVVHAEMEALLSCARNNVSSLGATLYCTTFPCHNCAKHIVAAGIQRVVYVEPYPKSKAPEFHDDSIFLGFSNDGRSAGKVTFESFVGTGPRNFINLFSIGLGSGYAIERKRNGKVLRWNAEGGTLRKQMLPYSYLQRESWISCEFERYREFLRENEGETHDK